MTEQQIAKIVRKQVRQYAIIIIAFIMVLWGATADLQLPFQTFQPIDTVALNKTAELNLVIYLFHLDLVSRIEWGTGRGFRDLGSRFYKWSDMEPNIQAEIDKYQGLLNDVRKGIPVDEWFTPVPEQMFWVIANKGLM